MRWLRGRRHGRHLRHQIFFALGGTIVLSVVVAGLVVHAHFGDLGELRAFEDFASDRFRAVWDEPVRRDDLARSIERHFGVQLTLRDPSGRVMFGHLSDCGRARHRVTVVDGNRELGQIEGCMLRRGWPKSLVYGLGSLVLVLWAASGVIARRLGRPLEELVQVVRDIGDGRLDARIQLCRHHLHGEVGEVARAVNLMAEKIERQILGQRELLAAVSHEIRSPLARLRVLIELEREQPGAANRLDSIDHELKEMDALVGQLLAQSRLEFQGLSRRILPATEIAETTLERAGLPRELLLDSAPGAKVNVDPGLLGRAMLNLVDNAQRHGLGLVAFAVRGDNDIVRFELRDRGPGFDATMLRRAFEPFVGATDAGGLGLGLSLVERIVRAHGGRVRLSNAVEGGALVVVELPRSLEP